MRPVRPSSCSRPRTRAASRGKAPAALMSSADETIGVVDLGGGSCEVAIGTTSAGPTWVRSWEAGALRVTRAFLPTERPSARDVRSARAEIRDLFDGLDPTRPNTALAVGGTARAVSKVIGSRFGARKLDELVERIARDGAAATTAGLDVTPGRTRDAPRRNAGSGGGRTQARLEARDRARRTARGRRARARASRVGGGVAAFSTPLPPVLRSSSPTLGQPGRDLTGCRRRSTRSRSATSRS